MYRQIIFILGCSWMLILAGCDRAPEKLNGIVYQDTPSVSALPVYRFAVHPLLNSKKLSKAYQPLIDYLNTNVQGAQFELEASRDYQAFEQKVSRSEPDVLLPNPWQTLKAQAFEYHVIAMAGDAQDFKGIFIARKDANIKQVKDIIGKTVSAPSATALAACIMPQFYLHQQGINVTKDIQTYFVGTHESTIMNVFLGQSLIGTTYPPPWRAFQKSNPEKAAEMEVLWETNALVNNSLMVKNTLPEPVIRQLKELLVGLNKNAIGLAILQGMETAAFYDASDQSYTVVADFIAQFERDVRPVVMP